MTMVDVSQLQVTKNNIEILKGLSFKIPEGQITAIVGPNGAGKNNLTGIHSWS